jgi:AraC family transcriptional regulator of adaptative response/methylated-DNA-[protein]-cysteine methyltransferase
VNTSQPVSPSVIRYHEASSFFGPALLAFSEKGLCALWPGGEASDLPSILGPLFATGPVVVEARMAPGDERWHGWLQTPWRSPPSLPLDIRGTGFQEKVWSALQALPPGQTRTYGELASELDQPTAYRAVAGACGANRLAWVVPCHRITGKTHEGGYRWGVMMKKALLEKEETRGFQE